MSMDFICPENLSTGTLFKKNQKISLFIDVSFVDIQVSDHPGECVS